MDMDMDMVMDMHMHMDMDMDMHIPMHAFAITPCVGITKKVICNATFLG